MHAVQKQYKALTGATKRNGLGSQAISKSLSELFDASLCFVADQNRAPATSNVPGKEYILLTEAATGKRSRPVNADLFDTEAAHSFLQQKKLIDAKNLEKNDRQKILYTLAMSFCSANDIQKNNDRKSPGTFFEIFVGHIFSSMYETEPVKHIQVLNLDAEAKLPTDYIFDLGPGKSKLHLPVKLSTRERVIQVWAHQRVLDGVYGNDRFRGILVSMAETNYQSKSNSVVEVCLPQQWSLYQMFIARLHRVYYLDIPEKYEKLATDYPFIQVKPFADFFDEHEQIAGPPSDG